LFVRLDHLEVALPALVFQPDVLNGDGRRVGVRVRQRPEFGDPAAEDLVGRGELPRLIIDLYDDVLAVVLERDLAARDVAPVPLDAEFENFAGVRTGVG
jgi:hypothetical protein